MPAIIVNGTPGNDTLVVTATSFDSGFYQLNSDPVQGFSAATGFTFNALAGNDIFTITNPVGTLFNAGGGTIFYNAGGDPTDAFSNLGGLAFNGFYNPGGGTQLQHVGPANQFVAFAGLLPTALITDTVTEGSFEVFGTVGADALTVTDGGLVGGDPTTQVNSNTFAAIRVSNKTQLIITGLGGNDTLDFNNPTPADGLTEVRVNNVLTVTQSGAVNYDNLSVVANGPVTLNGANDVDNLAANDDLDGGANTDTARYSGNIADYTFNLLPGGDIQVIDNRGGSPDGTDLVRNVEFFEFASGTVAAGALPFFAGPGADVLIGDDNPNDLSGLGGNDRIEGRGANDTLDGGEGDDLVLGEGGDDQISGGDGNDSLNGGDGNDTVNGGLGDDRLVGRSGNDTLDGGDGILQGDVNGDGTADIEVRVHGALFGGDVIL
ncbi:MAG TPA: calcium-binding protein [Beijerinckiaceae bacterium]